MSGKRRDRLSYLVAIAEIDSVRRVSRLQHSIFWVSQRKFTRRPVRSGVRTIGCEAAALFKFHRKQRWQRESDGLRLICPVNGARLALSASPLSEFQTDLSFRTHLVHRFRGDGVSSKA